MKIKFEPDGDPLFWEKVVTPKEGQEEIKIECSYVTEEQCRKDLCLHERLNDHGDACLDCGAVYLEGRWQ